MKFSKIVATVMLLGLVGLLGSPRASGQTVDEIVRRGTINIGVVDLPPYGLLNDKQEPDGYDIEVARLIGTYMGVKVNLVSLTPQNRIPFLLTNKVDLLVATLGITPERAKQVIFSIPYSAIENVVFARKDRTIAVLDDLRSLRVGVPRGSVQDVLLSKRFGNAIKVSRFDDEPSTYQALLVGQVDAVAVTGLTGGEFFAKNPDATIEPKLTLLQQPNGIAMRASQWDLHQWLNTFVYFTKNNGELDGLWQKWFHKPLPQLPTF